MCKQGYILHISTNSTSSGFHPGLIFLEGKLRGRSRHVDMLSTPTSTGVWKYAPRKIYKTEVPCKAIWWLFCVVLLHTVRKLLVQGLIFCVVHSWTLTLVTSICTCWGGELHRLRRKLPPPPLDEALLPPNEWIWMHPVRSQIMCNDYSIYILLDNV